MRGSRGGSAGSGPPPPWNLQSLISPILLEMKKIVIFHIFALPQLYVKQNQSYLRLDHPGKIFWIRACCKSLLIASTLSTVHHMIDVAIPYNKNHASLNSKGFLPHLYKIFSLPA